MIKTVTIFLDDFSVISEGMSNVYVYDFGSDSVDIIYDYYGYPLATPWDIYDPFFPDEILNVSTELSYQPSDYWGKPPEVQLSGTNYNGIRLENWGTYVDHYTDTYRSTSTSLYDPNTSIDAAHGDWVLDSFISRLNDPGSSDVIAIDYDFSDHTDWQYLFNPNYAPDGWNSGIEYIISDYLYNQTNSSDDYLLTGLSASLATPSLGTNELNALNQFLTSDAFVFQSTPNTNSSDYTNWSEYFPTVINIGAYNVDQSGTPQFGEVSQLYTTDIFADGLVYNSSFNDKGWNFGTSFATPIVVAETLNFFHSEILPNYSSGELSLDNITDLSDAEYSNVVDAVIGEISEEIKVKFSGFDDIYTARVLKEDLLDGTPHPSVIPSDFGGPLPDIEALWIGGNSAPVISGLTKNIFEINYGSEFYLDLAFTDSDYGDIAKFSAENLPDWLYLNPDTGLLQGTSQVGDLGAENIIITVTDYLGETDSEIISINFGNTTPTIILASEDAASDWYVANEDLIYSHQLSVRDLDVGDSHTFGYEIISFDPHDGGYGDFTAPPVPLWFSLDSNSGLITGTPDDVDAGEYRVVFSVSDSEGATSLSEEISLWVQTTNDAPTLVDANISSTNEDVFFEYQLSASDEDHSNSDLTFTSDNLPTWLSLSEDGLLSGTPENNDVGSETITVKVTDSGGAFDDRTFSLTVNNTNDAPVLEEILAPSSINEDSLFEYQLSASDIDAGVSDEMLTFTSDNLPTWLSLSEDGLLSGTPENNDVGSETITVKVTDSGGASSEKTFTLSVNNTNDAPTLVDANISSTNEDVFFEYQLSASDEDHSNSDLTFTSDNLPTWLSLSEDGLLSGTPENNDVGSETITVKVTDSGGAFDDRTFSLTVNNTNDAPVLEEILAPSSINEDSLFEYQLSASDIDAGVSDEMLTFTSDNLPTWLSLSEDGLLSGTPENNDVGSETITVKVTDSGGASSEKTFTLSVNNTNDAPVLEEMTVTSIDEKVLFEYQLSASDPDISVSDDIISFESIDLPLWLTLSPGGFLSGTPSGEDIGIHDFSLNVKDSMGITFERLVSFEVENVNDSPFANEPLPDYFPSPETKVFFEDFSTYFNDKDLLQTSTENLNYSISFLTPTRDAPSNFYFDEETGMFSLLPRLEDAGAHVLKITATDVEGLAVSLDTKLFIDPGLSEIQTIETKSEKNIFENGTIHSITNPQIFNLEDSKILVFWDTYNSGIDDGKYFQVFDSSMDAVSLAKKLETVITGNRHLPQFEYLGNGKFCIFGTDQDNYPNLAAQIFDVDGNSIVEKFEVNETLISSTWAYFDDLKITYSQINDELVFGWKNHNFPNYGEKSVVYKKFNSKGESLSQEETVLGHDTFHTAISTDDGHIFISTKGAANSISISKELNNKITTETFQFEKFETHSHGFPKQLKTFDENSAFSNVLSGSFSDGSFVLVFIATTENTWDNTLDKSLFAQHFDFNGKPVGQVTQIKGDLEHETHNNLHLLNLNILQDDTYVVSYNKKTNWNVSEGHRSFHFNKDGSLASELQLYDDFQKNVSEINFISSNDGLSAFYSFVELENDGWSWPETGYQNIKFIELETASKFIDIVYPPNNNYGAENALLDISLNFPIIDSYGFETVSQGWYDSENNSLLSEAQKYVPDDRVGGSHIEYRLSGTYENGIDFTGKSQSILIQEVEHPTRFLSEPVTAIDEDVPYLYQIGFEDADELQEIQFSVLDVPEWLSLDGESLLSGTPHNEDVGTYTIRIELTDNFGNTQQKFFDIEVNNTNDDPVLAEISAPSSTDEDAPFEYQLTATDIDMDVVDNETLTYEAVEKPGWMSVSSSGLITGTPENDDVGEHAITVKVTDSAGESDTKTFRLQVNNTNDAPVLESIPNSSTDEDAPFEYQLTATDVDMNVDVDEKLTFEAVEKPDWMSVSSSGLITGTPENDDVAEHSVTVKVTDNAGVSDTKTFTLTVNNTNDAPVINVGDTDSALVDAFDGSAFSHQLGVSDVDEGDTHVHSIESVKFAAPNGISSGYSSSEGISNRPSLEQVGDSAGSTDLYWRDHDGYSYLITTQNVGAYSSQTIDDGNIAFVYAVHSGTEWQLNYRVFDPARKTFKTEETSIGSNIQTDAVGGVQVYLSLDQLGSGRLGIELHHEKDYEYQQGAHKTLKYVELNWLDGDYLTSPGTSMVPQLTSYRPMTGPEEKLDWVDANGDYHLVALTSREVLDTSYEYLLNGNILTAWVENDGAARCRVFDPNNKVFLSEATLIASDPIFTESYQITSSLNHEYGDTATYAIQIVNPATAYGAPEYRSYRLDNLNLPDVDVQVGYGAGLSTNNDSTGSTDLLLDDNGQSYLVTEQNVGAYSSQLLNDGNMAIVYAVHHGSEWHLNYRIFDPTIKDFITDETSIASNLQAEAIGGVNVSIELTALGESGFSAELKNATQGEQTLKYTEVTQSLDVQHNELRPIDDISWLSLDTETGLLSGTPDDEDVGLYEIVFSVEDAAGVVSTSDPVALTVNNINDPVYIDEGQSASFKANKEGIYQIAISDEDLADSYTFTADDLPDWLSLDPATGILTGTPTRADDGIYTIDVTVTDAGGLSDTDTISIKSTSYQYASLGSDADFFMGEYVQDHISTGGGDDKIYAAGGDDVVVVQGQGDVEVDTGAGDDTVIVEDGWSGTLLVKNGSGSNVLEIGGNQEDFDVDIVDGKVQLTTGNGSTITIDEQHSLNEETGLVEISDKGFEYIKIDGHDEQGLLHEGEFAYSTYIVLGSNDANYLVANQPDDAESNDEVFVLAGDGADLIEASAHNVMIEGGEGDDTIRLGATSGKKSVFGDIFNGDSGGIVSSQNSSYADVVEIDWSYTDSVIDSVAHGYRIINSELDAVVEVYDVEILKFANGDGTWDTRYLTNGAPVDKDSWMNGHAGKDIAYGDGSDVRFVLGNGTAPEGAALSDNGTSDILQVYANITTVTQQSYVYYQRGSAKRTSPAKGWARKTGKRDVESTEEALIWEGDRTAVDAFTFSDNVSINVINVADKSWNDAEIEYTLGTDGIDLIFGNDSDNLIDGKGGDDIIFGGDGEDVIIGGEGDDVLVGGAGDDIIRGDGVDDMDAAMTYFADLDDFDTDTLSIETSTVVEGNDVILGGDGIDDIESGEGKNLVASGRADMDGDGEADLDTIKEHMTAHKDIFEDDDWI